MGTQITTGRKGFTLIELLVVITILALLASVSYPVVSGVIDTARRTEAKAAMGTLATAITSYHQEYHRMPVDPATGVAADREVSSDGDLLRALLGYNDGPIPNPRERVFLSFPLTRSGRGGYSPADGAVFDPWGAPYRIIIDADYDGRIADPDPGGGGEIPMTVLVYSYGKNGASAPWSRRVLSWR